MERGGGLLGASTSRGRAETSLKAEKLVRRCCVLGLSARRYSSCFGIDMMIQYVLVITDRGTIRDLLHYLV